MYNGAVLPLIEEYETEMTSEEMFGIFRGNPYCFWLDSALNVERLGRYSLMGCSPFLLFKSRGDTATIIKNGAQTVEKGNPFDILGRYLDIYRLDMHDAIIPCTGGAVGWFSYDLCRLTEKLPSRAVDDLSIPECFFGFYDLMLVVDHLLKKTFIVSTGFPELDERKRTDRAQKRLRELRKQIHAYKPDETGIEDHQKRSGAAPLSNFIYDAYLRAVSKAQQYIIDGDIFEVNISQRFEVGLPVPPFELYRRLRRINPAPFSVWLDYDEVKIAGSSPERFIKLTGDQVETRPIKGTIRRGENEEEDRVLAERLLSSGKDRAENMMIGDLERNDLGRVCRFGTVKVTELAILEKYSTVFHLTSTIVGQLREKINRIDLIKAAFPGGSITGAPKIRSMEIIDELEPNRRSIYTGSIGYLSFNGDIDLNIVIRTFLIKGGKAYFQVGGAVVYDSDPELEYQETLLKGRALVATLGLSERPG